MSNPHDILSDRAHRIRMRTNVPSSSSSNNTTNHHQSSSSSSSSSSSVVYPSSNATNFFGFQLSTSPKTAFANNNNTNSSSTTSAQNQNQLRIRLIAERAAIRQRVRRDLAKQQNAIRRQREFSERTRVWNEDILPNWNELIYSNKVKELCYKGIPPNIRGKVWPLLIGNDLEIDEKLFEALTNKAHNLFGHKMTAAKSKLVLSNSQENDSNMPIASYESNSYPDSMEDEFFLHNKDNFSSSSKSIPHTTSSFSHNMITKPVSLTGFERSDTIVHDRQFAMDDRSISHDIPIPKQTSSLIDITDEPWFENERDGSLDQEAFHMIQRQLFLHNPTIPPPSTAPIAPINTNTKPATGAPVPSPGSYLMKKIKDTNLAFDPANVPHSDSTSSKTNNEEISSSLGSNHSFNLPSTGISHDTAFPFDLDYSNDDHESPRNRPRVSSPIKSQPLSRNGSFAQMKPMTPHDIRDLSTDSLKKISETPPDSHILDISSDHVTTPPRRTKHSPDYLIDAGLIVDIPNVEIHQTILLQRIPSGIATPSKRRTMSNASKYSDQQEKPTKGHFAPNVFGDQEGGGDKRFGENMIAFLPLDSEQPRFSVKQVDRKRLLSSDLASQLANLTLDEVNEQTKLEKELNDSQHTIESEDPEMVKLTNVISLIEWDLPRTFPTLAFFHDGGMMHTGLERVLYCFALFRSDIGYVQGMSFLVATLLLYMDEYEAFKCLSNLLSRRIYTDFYGLKKKAIDSYVMCFDYYFKKLLPLLYNHFRHEDVTSEMFLMDWNLSLFTKALPLEVAAHVWDIYLFEGEMFILCVGLGILKLYAPILSTFSVEKISPFLLHLPENIKSEELFASINQINISKKHYEKIRRRMIEEVYGSQNVPSSSDPSNQQPATTSTTTTSGIGAFKAVRNSIKQSLFTFLPSGHHYSSEPNLQAMISEEISSSNHSGSSIQDQLTPPRSTLSSNNANTLSSSTNVSPEHSLPQKQLSHDQTLSPQTSPSQAHSLPDTSHPTPSHHKSHHTHHNNHNSLNNNHHLPPSHHHPTHKSTPSSTTSTPSPATNNTTNTTSTSSKHKPTSKKSSGDCLPS